MALITFVDYPVKDLEFTRKSGKSVMQTLAEIASNYEYGVNEDGRFYFRPYSGKVIERFWIGHGDLKTFEPGEIEAKYNAYKVLCGELTSGDNYILEVKDVPADEYERWGILELPESVPPFSLNLALGLPIGQLLSDPAGAGLVNIVDGNPATEWNSGAYQQIGHFLQIDLGSIKSYIGRVVVDSTEIANVTTDFADGFRVLISDSISGNNMVDATEVFASIKVFGSNNIAITFPATSGRYIRVEINNAKPYFWRVGEFGVYEWDIGDITRWAGFQLFINRESVKKGKLELSSIDRKISPRGKVRITTESGSAYYDYPIISTKYHFNAKSGLQVSLELGETTRSIADELLMMKRQLTERRLMGTAKGRQLSGGIWTSRGSDQRVDAGEIETRMIKSINADLSNITAGNGVITINADGIEAIKDAVTMFYLSAITGGAFFRGTVEAGALVVPVGTDKWAS